MDIDALRRQLTLHEGRTRSPYRDSEGKLTIGIGHNLDDRPLSDRVVDMIFEEDVGVALRDLALKMPWYVSLSERRQLVLADMCFNLGIGKLLLFVKMIAALRRGDWNDAAAEMLDSKWARQVGNRALRLSTMMREG